MKPSESKKAQAKATSASAPVANIWGLTGGIASGKSTVARIFSEAGVPVLDADQVARELRAPGGAAYDAIVAQFGTADAQRLREIVFSDPVARSKLEAILHPLIRAQSAKRMEAMLAGKTGTVPVIYEATLLVESGRYKDFAGLIVVSASEEVRLARLMARDKNPEELSRRMISSQIGDENRRSHATFVIENHGSVEDLRKQVLALLPKLA